MKKMKRPVTSTCSKVKALGIALALAALFLLAPVALAAGDPAGIDTGKFHYIPDSDHYTHPPFAPSFSYSTSTTRAGAHPDLTLKLTKMRSHCRGWLPSFCDPADFYAGADLKKEVFHFPRGLMGDINAVPYCDASQVWVPEPNQANYDELYWRCNNTTSRVGEAYIEATGCQYETWEKKKIWCPTHGSSIQGPGDVFMERPDPGEQGHLVVLWPREPTYEPIGPETAYWTRADVSVTVRDSDTGIDAVADNIPDYVVGKERDQYGIITEYSLGQPYYIDITIFGSTGAESGHPLLTNPTFCDPQSLDVEAQAYAVNSSQVWDENHDAAGIIPGSGEGITAPPFSFPYQATNCDQVLYNPNLSLTLDNQAPDQAPAISSTVTQEPGEATTDSVKVTFPSQFKINAENTAEHCSAENLKATDDDPAHKDHCPEASRIGAVTAESPLLPIGQKLEGSVYLAGLTGDSVKFSAFLHGFVDLRIDASGKVEDDLTLTTTFSDLPAVPISRFDLSLEGGDKGLLRTPRVCGPETISADFTSHSKKVKQNTVPVDIEGCTDPTLDVELSNRRKGEKTDLDVTVSSPGTAIRSVELGLARQLKWGRRKHNRVPRKKRLKSVGTASFITTSGERKIRLKARHTHRGNLAFTPLLRKSREGKVVAAQVPGFQASLFRTARHQPGIRARKREGNNKRSDRKRHQAAFTLNGLPGADTTAVELSLKGKSKRRRFYLKNPLGCKKRLNFVAYVTTTQGVKLALKDKVRLKGKGCKKKKKKKKK